MNYTRLVIAAVAAWVVDAAYGFLVWGQVLNGEFGRYPAVFRAADDHVFALQDACPHKGGPLSQGIVHGHRVTCPMHGWNVELDSGEACAPDHGCARRYATRVADGEVFLKL